MKLEQLQIFPVKSLRGMALTEAEVTPQGLLGDRLWLIATPDGEMITARKYPPLLLWHTEQEIALNQCSLNIQFPDSGSLKVHSSQFNQAADVQVWKDRFQAYCGDDAADALLSEKLGFAVRLFWLGQHSDRQVKDTEIPLTFADAAPFLLTNLASLADLNTQIGANFEIERFRGNIVISGSQAYEEETWQRIQIGEVRFHLYKPCVRCVMPTVDLRTGEKHPQQQPLSYLAKERNAIFGMNMLAENTGVLRVGDEVKVLA